jgi:HEAT repeat protein
MGGRAPGDRSSDPAELLRGALEKIVFFECRVSQLESELRAAVKTAERASGDASASHRKAVELEGALAAARGAREESGRRSTELEERVRLLEGERERLLAGLVEQARVAGAPGAEGDMAGDQADLAGFIAELRGEIEELRRFKASVMGEGPHAPTLDRQHPPHPSVEEIAGRLADEGRFGVSARDAGALRAQLTTQSDRVLFEEAIERLRAPEAATRLRAVRRLEAFGPGAAAPLLAAAVGREQDEGVKVALLGALARVEEPFAADLVASALQDRRPAVRAAALDALAHLSPARAEPCTLASLGDESTIVRRRAVLLLALSKSAQADEALAAALRDSDSGVARAAAAALAGRPSAGAQAALAHALEHGDARVRRSAAETLGRWSGERIDGDAPVHERRRAARRIAEKLAAMAPAEVRTAVVESADRPRPTDLRVHRFAGRRISVATVRASAGPGPRQAPRPLAPALARGGVGEAGVARKAARVAVVEAAPARAVVVEAAAPAELGPLDDAIVAELRAALRGRAATELSGLLSAPEREIETALQALAARGAVVARGPRWYVG